MSEIVSIVYKPMHVEANPSNRYVRFARSTANLMVNYGIEGDRKGGNPNRQLNVMSQETLNDLRAEGFRVEPGAMGEQLIVTGLDVTALQPGDRVQLGDTACIEVISHRKGCERFEHIQGKPRTNCAGRLGIMAKVVADGEIRVGDPVKLLQPEHV